MAKVILTMKAHRGKRQLYMDGRLKFGARVAQKTVRTIEKIQKNLELFPNMGYREPLLQDSITTYRTIPINKRFKIIYWYNEAKDMVVIEDIWDMRRAPQNLKKRIITN